MFFVALWAAPFVWMVSTSFKPISQVMTLEVEWLPREVTLDNYRKVLEYPIATWAMNSLIVAAVATALCVLFGAMAGYALARLRFPGRNLIFLLFLASHHDPAGGRRRAAAPRHDQGRLGEHLPGADPADSSATCSPSTSSASSS